ncbi:MAG: hypothetical protein KDI63_14895, partial [Gammaproteobacteria bacterium]|nr:hypothetical protein [Gammaproteobacteria bacterium]
NSLEGITAALQAGAAYVELDVQSLADGTLVLFHDPTLLRTTGSTGEIFELTRNQLCALDANEPTRLGTTFRNIRIPLLEDFVELLSRFPGSGAFVEIKSESLIRFGLQPVMEKLLQTLRPVIDRSVVISFRSGALGYLRKYAPQVRVGLILQRLDEERRRRTNRLRPEFLIVDKSLLRPKPPPWTGNWKWVVYDIVDPELALRYARAGIPLVETRDIQAMLEHPLIGLNAGRGGTENPQRAPTPPAVNQRPAPNPKLPDIP